MSSMKTIICLQHYEPNSIILQSFGLFLEMSCQGKIVSIVRTIDALL